MKKNIAYHCMSDALCNFNNYDLEATNKLPILEFSINNLQ